MFIAKLNTGRLVRFLKFPQSVPFAQGEHVLISDIVSENPNRLHPYWVLRTQIMWVLKIPTSIV